MGPVMARSSTDIDRELRRRSVKPRLLFGVLNLVLFGIAVWAVYEFAPPAADKGLFLKLAGGGVILGMWGTHASAAGAFAKAGWALFAVLVVAWAGLAGWFVAGL